MAIENDIVFMPGGFIQQIIHDHQEFFVTCWKCQGVSDVRVTVGIMRLNEVLKS